MKPLVGVLNIALARAMHEEEHALMHECLRGVVEHMMHGVEEIIGFRSQHRWLNLTKWVSHSASPGSWVFATQSWIWD